MARMSAHSPDARDPRQRPDWLPGRGALIAAALAFGLGLVAFLALWWDQRNNSDFYRSEPGLPQPGQVFEPLPTPLPAGDRGSLAREEEEDAAPDPSDPALVGGAEAPTPSSAPPPPQVAAPAAPTPSSLPRPIQQPAPRYPRDAYRRGESGTVLLRVHVGADGDPRRIDLVSSSGSRSLDRAAVDAVNRWRFAPAMRGETPVEGSVQVPIEFSLGR